MARMLFNCTHGRDDPERAIVPFIAANVAAVAGQRVKRCRPTSLAMGGLFRI